MALATGTTTGLMRVTDSFKPSYIMEHHALGECDISQSVTCQREHNMAVAYIDELTAHYAKVNDFRETSDYKNYGLLPGQQIYYGGAFKVQSLTHHGIYVGDGYVVEVGQGPVTECGTRGSLIAFKEQTVGFSTLANFQERAEKQGSSVMLVMTDEDDEPLVIGERLQRTKASLGNHDYNILFGNCQHTANYITYGEYFSEQSEMIGSYATNFSTLFISALTLANSVMIKINKDANNGQGGLEKSSNPNCMKGTCIQRQITDDDCICMSEVYRGLRGRYCYVNPRLCKGAPKDSNGLTYNWVSDSGNQKTMCRRKAKRGQGEKYLNCEE
jgi:hypothetical protein